MAVSNASNESTPRTFSNLNTDEACSGNDLDPATAKNISGLSDMNLHHPALDSESGGNYSYDYADDGETSEQDVLPTHSMSPRYPGQQLQQRHLQQLQLLQQQRQQQEQAQQQMQHNLHYYHQMEPINGESQVMTGKELRKSMKIRKVRSEMKYVETPTVKDAAKKDKKKESKSDHEFANDSDVSDHHNFSNMISDILWHYFMHSGTPKITCSLHY